ncbi:hypothetical protein [Acinetobacter sp.]|uniref:hypothetical protein n=2 Tax=Acinetobacter sp. TaxID=472 RepID=UPI002FC8B15E
MNIIDLQRILYPMSKCLQTVRKDYFYFGYSSDLAISIKNISDEKWELNTYERGEIISQEFYLSEYITCLKFLYHIDKISTDDPNTMKLIDYSENWALLEKNKEFYFCIQSSRPYIYSDFSIILTAVEIQNYRSLGRNFLFSLQSEIDASTPIRTSSNYHKRKINNNLENELSNRLLDEFELLDVFELNAEEKVSTLEQSKLISDSPTFIKNRTSQPLYILPAIIFIYIILNYFFNK